MATTIQSKFNAKCTNCKHQLTVIVNSQILKETMIVFTCSKCKTANFLNSEEILNGNI